MWISPIWPIPDSVMQTIEDEQADRMSLTGRWW